MTIKAYSYFDTTFVTNTDHSITGNDVGDFADSTMGAAAYVAKSGGYTATESDEVINVTGLNITITLPACASTRVGKRYTVRKAGTNSAYILVAASGSDTINGFSTIPLVNNQHVTVVNTGSEWIIVASVGWNSGLLFVQNAAVTVASTASETTLTGAGNGTLTLPVFFYKANTILEVSARGYASNTGTPTLRMKVKNGSTALGDTTAVTTASGLSNTGWRLDLRVVCRTSGGSGTVMAQGEFQVASNTYPMVNTAAITVDGTVTQLIDLTAQWGTSSASNTITCQELIAKVIR